METEKAQRQISVIDPISPAVDRVRSLLFAPFSVGAWLVFGFAAWLAVLGRQEISSGVAFLAGKARRSGSMGDAARETQQWLVDTSTAVFTWIALGGVAFVFFGLLGLWLSSRGRFIFLDCVVRKRSRLGSAWREFATQANSMFLFRLCLGGLGSAVFIPPLIVMVIQTYRLLEARQYQVDRLLIMVACVAVCALLLAGILLIGKLTNDLVAPIMYRRRIKALAAWAQVATLSTQSIGPIIRYAVFQVCLQMVAGTIGIVAVLATCGVAAIPYLGTLILLPVIVFDRAYSLYFLGQYGEEFRLLD